MAKECVCSPLYIRNDKHDFERYGHVFYKRREAVQLMCCLMSFLDFQDDPTQTTPVHVSGAEKFFFVEEYLNRMAEGRMPNCGLPRVLFGPLQGSFKYYCLEQCSGRRLSDSCFCGLCRRGGFSGLFPPFWSARRADVQSVPRVLFSELFMSGGA